MSPAARAGSRAADPVVHRPGGDVFLTPPELAGLLKTTPGVLRKWRYLGRGPAYVKDGQTIRYRRSAVDAYLDAHTHN